MPKNFDWEEFLPKPINQSQCGSCYLISTLQMIEARLLIHYNEPIKLSTAFINDCNYYSQGCNGGYSMEVMRFIFENYALPLHCKQSYNKRCVQYCSENEFETLKVVKLKSYGYVGGFYNAVSEEDIKFEIFKNGPVVMSLQSPLDLGFYLKGVYKPIGSTSVQDFGNFLKPEWVEVNHSVLVYGWGEKDGVKFWRAQNSWGEEWGEKGRFKILRGQNVLGLESMVESGMPYIIDLGD